MSAISPGNTVHVGLTIMTIIPAVFSRRVQNAAITRMRIVTGIAANVRANSTVAFSVTITTNWTVNPRKKKKSNFSKAM